MWASAPGTRRRQLAGASHLVEHLLFKGTSRRPTPGEISGTVEGVGGEINAGTEQELTVYWCKAARPYMEECLDLLVDMAMGSVFDPEELERERMVVLEEQNQVNDFPNNRVEAMLDGLLWPDHPLGGDVSGTREVDLRYEPRGGDGALPRGVLAEQRCDQRGGFGGPRRRRAAGGVDD